MCWRYPPGRQEEVASKQQKGGGRAERGRAGEERFMPPSSLAHVVARTSCLYAKISRVGGKTPEESLEEERIGTIAR
jgi:hypothetical protein